MLNRLVFWIAIGFLIYVMATGRFSHDKVQLPANTQTATPEQTPAKPSLITNAIDNIIRPASEGKFPLSINAAPVSPTEPQHVTDTTAGTGNVALCGSRVSVHYALSGEPKSTTPTEFTVGERSVFPGLEAVVIGMREKGVRKAELPPALAYNNMELAKEASTSSHLVPLEVVLDSSSPAISYEPHAVQLFDKIPGTGKAAQCFDTVRAHYTVRTFEGKLLVDTETQKLPPLVLSIGSGRIPLGVEQALLGLKEGGIRTAILFPEAMQRLKSEDKMMLENEDNYPNTGLIFEFKRLAENANAQN